MGEQFTHLLDATISYPDNKEHVMHDMLFGHLTKIVIKVEAKEITPDLIGDYFGDESFRHRFQLWLNSTWQQKDEQLSHVHANDKALP